MDPEVHTSSMIALLPTESSWVVADLPHLTLVYGGEIAGMPDGAFNTLAKDACSLAAMNSPITLEATGVELFGDHPDQVDVLRFRSNPALDSMRHLVRHWDASDWPFNPHVTIGPPGSHVLQSGIPNRVVFDTVYVGWGDQCLTFRMGRNY